jgi:hypothetical protein
MRCSLKKLTALFLFLILSLPALAVDDAQVMYIGGTAPGMAAGTVGSLDTTAETALIFEHTGSRLEIPYAAIESHEYSTEVTHHLGVLPAVAVGMVRIRKHRHYFRVTYRNADGVAQVAVFEVPKQMPRTLQAVLAARAARAKTCAPCAEN